MAGVEKTWQRRWRWVEILPDRLIRERGIGLLEVTDQGLYCRRGNFFIDPVEKVATSLLTHGHADHAREGCGTYYAHSATCEILQARWESTPPPLMVKLQYDEVFSLGEVRVSLHPAGHILGSSQIRLELGGEVWVVTGDFKRAEDLTCEKYTPVRCDVLVMESTFALHIFRWEPLSHTCQKILDWCALKWAEDKVPVLFSYSLGKTQSLLAGLAQQGHDQFYLHPSARKLCQVYESFDVKLPGTRLYTAEVPLHNLLGSVLILPPILQRSKAFLNNPLLAPAFTSGWMQIRGMRRRRNLGKGFVLSDHADWPALTSAVLDSGARTVYTTHGYSDVLARYINEFTKAEAFELKVLKNESADL